VKLWGKRGVYSTDRGRPRVPCVPCVSRLPPVSFYREKDTGGSRDTHGYKDKFDSEREKPMRCTATCAAFGEPLCGSEVLSACVSEERVRQCGATLADEITVRVATCALTFVLIAIGIDLCRSYKERWKKFSTGYFRAIDTDNTDTVDENELYIAVLELHHRLPSWLYVKPPERIDVQIMFHMLDKDGSGLIDLHEFDEMLMAMAMATAARCLVINALRAVIAYAIYSMRILETPGALPAWVQCFGLTIQDTLGIRADAPLKFLLYFFLSKRLALPIASYLIHSSTFMYIQQKPMLQGSRDIDSIRPDNIRKRLLRSQAVATIIKILKRSQRSLQYRTQEPSASARSLLGDDAHAIAGADPGRERRRASPRPALRSRRAERL